MPMGRAIWGTISGKPNHSWVSPSRKEVYLKKASSPKSMIQPRTRKALLFPVPRYL